MEQHRKLKKQVLIIHNNENIYCEIRQELESPSTKVICASTLDEAVKLFVNNEICLVIMDATLSEDDNHQFLRMMRIAKPVPILLLSSNTEYSDRLRAFQAGANAYLGKPYTLDECIAQARSLIDLYVELKSEVETNQPLVFGKDLIIEPAQRVVFLQGKFIELTRKEFDILLCLASHPEQVLSREQIYRQAWGLDIPFDVDEAVKSQIKTLRKKLSDANTEYIKNVWGVGYRFHIKKDGNASADNCLCSV